MLKLLHRVTIIEGQLANPDPIRDLAGAAGVELLGSRRARLIQDGHSIYLVGVKIIIRARGRLRRHLSRYLIARDQRGTLYEIFLGLVRGAGSAAVDLWSCLRLGVAWLASRGLTPWQIRGLLR